MIPSEISFFIGDFFIVAQKSKNDFRAKVGLKLKTCLSLVSLSVSALV